MVTIIYLPSPTMVFVTIPMVFLSGTMVSETKTMVSVFEKISR